MDEEGEKKKEKRKWDMQIRPEQGWLLFVLLVHQKENKKPGAEKRGGLL